MARLWIHAAILTLAMPVAAACSSGSGGGSGSGGASCQSLCSDSIAAGCTTKTQEQCSADCSASLGKIPAECQSVELGATACLFEHFQCDLANVEVMAAVEACPSEFAAYAGCTACVADASDDACEACEKANCCQERKAALGDPNALKYSSCITACADTQCISSCDAQYPGMRDKLEQLSNCQNAACPGC